jgi:hypothetical protein
LLDGSDTAGHLVADYKNTPACRCVLYFQAFPAELKRKTGALRPLLSLVVKQLKLVLG